MWLKKQVLKEYDLETMLREKTTTWRRKPSVSVEHWSGARTVLEYDPIEDMCVHCSGSWDGNGALSKYLHATQCHSG